MHTGDPFGWVGSIIDGQFAVEEPAGEGAFGIVYRGRHLGFDVPIAIKCLKIPADLSAEQREEFLAKFREEARLLHRLSRRTMGIVQALDIGAAAAPSGQWAPYIVMEWLEGQTLEQYLRRRREEERAAPRLEDAMQLLGPVAAALAIAHEENVSHRDVKPANLFLARSRDGELVKVLDFGLAKVFAETPTVTEALAQTGRTFRAFTPQYGAPEQFSPRYGATGPWTDVYAMALILVEVAAGRPALAGNDVIQLFVASSDEAHRPTLRALGVEASAGVEDVLLRALAVNPASRFHDLGQMWAALEATQRVSMARPTPAPRARETLRVPAPPVPVTPRPPPPRESQAPLHATRGVAFAVSARGPGDLRAGTESPPLVGPEAGENRVCTVMFTDLSEAAALSARLDPEEVKDVVDRCLRLLAEHVEKMGGIVEKPVGDRAMAVFGVPRSTDHDAERAIVAALGVQAAVARLPLPRAARQARISVRIGIATGRVFVGPAGSSRAELAVIGDAVGAAARLQQLAPRGAIVIGRDTHRLLRGRCQVEPIEVSPGAPPMYRVLGEGFDSGRSSLPWASSRRGGAVAEFHGVKTRLVGRGAEMQRLRDAVDTVLHERRARLVTLVGAPGVGRTRLLAELAASLGAEPGVWGPARPDGADEGGPRLFVMEVQCSPLARETSYGLAASLIRSRFGILETDPPEVARRKLRRGLRWLRARTAPPPPGRGVQIPRSRAPFELGATVRVGTGFEPPSVAGPLLQRPGASTPPSSVALGLREVEDVLGRIATILGAQPALGIEGARVGGFGGAPEGAGRVSPFSLPPLEVARTAGAPDAKHRILGALFRLTAFALDRTPLVILCDDAQWADDASLDLIDDLVARAEDLPLCVVCAARPELYERRAPGGDAGDAGQDPHRRPGWGSGRAAHEPIEVLPLARRHVEDMIRDRLRRVRDLGPELPRKLADRAEGNPRTLEESLQLLLDAGVIDAASDVWTVREAALGTLSLPATVQGIVQARLDRLDPEARGVVALASVIGRTFWEGAIERLRQAAPQNRSPRASEPLVQLDDLDPPFSVAPGDLATAKPAAPLREDGGTPTAQILALLCERQLIRQRSPASIAGEREYVFAEGSICEVAYEMLSLKVRRRIHLLVAGWLEQAPGAIGAALLALHYDRGGDLRDAAAAYARAAAHAASVGEGAEVRRLLQRVREIHDEASEAEDPARDPASGARTARHADRPSAAPRAPLGGTQRSPSWEGTDRRVAPWRERVRVRLELGDLLRQAGDVEGAARAYEEGRGRILREERRFGPGIDPLEQLRWEARVDFRMALVQEARGARLDALELSRRAFERAVAGGAEGEIDTIQAFLEFLESGAPTQAT